MKEEKTGTAAELIFHNETNFYTILLFETDEEQFCAVGNLPQPRKGRRYRLLGEWKNHPKYGEQFVFSSAEELEPTTEEGIISFLSSGIIKGVGPATALAIVKHFGGDTLKIMQEKPELLTQVSGIGPVKAAAIAESYSEHREYADTVLALSAFDINPTVCYKLYKAYGAGAVEIVKANPYKLIDDVYGVGFIKADKIAERVGIAPDSPFRIKSAVIYGLNQRARDGDTFAPEADFTEKIAGLLDVTREQVSDCIYELAMEGRVFKENLGGADILILWRYKRAEQYCAVKLNQLCSATLTGIAENTDELIARAEREKGITLSEQQKNAVISSLKNGVSIITGGPGTGKTTIINAILTILKAADIKTELAAPTGRAAKRMSQAAGEEARTIHRLLEYYYSEGDDSMCFGRNAENPLEADCIIIDEASMVDILLMEGLLSAVRPGTRLIFVGDADQLPPVGAGNVLADMLSSDMIHSTRLTDIFRQAAESMIVVNAHRINRGEYPSYNEKDKDFFMLERSREDAIAATILELCSTRLPIFYKDIDPYRDIQVLTPTRKGALGSVSLNARLQQVLNPPDPGKNEKAIGERIFREGDKVMQTRNNYQLPWRNLSSFADGEGVFNGDMGLITNVDNNDGTVTVLFDGERQVVYDYSLLEELEPAFALTVHKSQGSEFPVIVMPVTAFPPMLATRNLFYTAVTRARKGVILVGNPAAAGAMVDNNSTKQRCSGLGERLKALWIE